MNIVYYVFTFDPALLNIEPYWLLLFLRQNIPKQEVISNKLKKRFVG